MSTLLYVENPIVLSDDSTTPVMTIADTVTAKFGASVVPGVTSTTKLLFFTFPTKYHPRQLWEYKFKINSSKMASNHIAYLNSFEKDYIIPQILINNISRLLGVFVSGPMTQAKDADTGLPLWIDPTTDLPTTTVPYHTDGTINMDGAWITWSYYEYLVGLQQNRYYTLRIILDYIANSATVMINNTVIGLNSIYSDNGQIFYADSYGDMFKNCEFLDVDYFKIIDLNHINSNPENALEDLQVVTTIDSTNNLQDGVM